MKNAFYFILKALFVLKIFRFLSWLFGHVGFKKDLIRKIRLTWKMCLMLHFINWPNFIVWLLLLLKILGNICIPLLVNQPATSYNLTKFAIFYHSPILLAYHNKSSTTHPLVTQYLESFNPLSMFPLSIHVS